MRQRLVTTLIVAAGVVGLSLTSCKPSYPKCESDETCAEKGEVCANGACQECRADEQCVKKHGADSVCNSGRCEAKVVATAPKTECVKNEDCQGGQRCDNQKCTAGCTTDQECGPGMACQDGACVKQTTKISSQCRPMTPGAGDIIAMGDVFFDFDKYELRVDTREALDKNLECFKQAPEIKVIVEGYCDERGTQEYNLALGEQRANAVLRYFKNAGIAGGRMNVRSKGKNEPLCSEHTDACWAKNRRVKFIQSR